MKTTWTRNSIDTLYTSGAIAAKDILEALKNRGIFVNILMALGLVLFFHYMLNVRTFDKDVDVLVYDEGSASLPGGRTELTDGYTLVVYQVTSLEQMHRNLGTRELGVTIPTDFDQLLAAGGVATLNGYINWADRSEVSELEAQYTRQFSELFGQPVQVTIGGNIIKPRFDTLGDESAASFHLLLASFYMAMLAVPQLMLIEKVTKTMEALLVSPVSSAQLVLGKALAGLLYVALSTGLSFYLNQVYFIHWGLAILTAFCSAAFGILLALAVGNLIRAPLQSNFLSMILFIVILVPAWFVHVPNLSAGVKSVLIWLPTSALAQLFRFSCSVGAPPAQILLNLGIALGFSALLFMVVIWQLRRSDR